MKHNVTDVSNFFVELDCIMDTRLGTISKVLNKDFIKINDILANKYHSREFDVFKLDMELYKDLYSKRDRYTLKDSYMTPIVFMIKEFCEKTILQIKSSPFHYKPKLTLNIHPYELEESEIKLIMKSLISITKGEMDVEVVNMSYEDITPSYIKNNTSVLCLYEYIRWLETHSLNDNFKKYSCPETIMIAPKIYFSETNSSKHDSDFFKAIEELSKPFINLNITPIETFSVPYKPNKT